MKLGLILLAIILISSGFVIGVNTEDEFDVIIKFEDYHQASPSKTMKASFLKTPITNIEYNINGKIKNRFKSFNGVSAKVGKEEYERLMNNPNVKVSPNYKIALHLFNATEIMNATGSWNMKYSEANLTGTGQTICILDGGINYSHPDFGGCTTADFTSGNCAKVIGGYDIGENDNDPMDYDGHGTHVSGIIAANGGVNGIAKGANIVMVKVFDDAGNGNTDNIISGIEWCTNNASIFNISVITASIGLVDGNLDPILRTSSCDAEFGNIKTAIDAAVAKNISVLFSSGNNGSSTQIGTPACISSSIPVSSTDKLDSISSFSNRNSLVKLFATGGTSGGTTTCSNPNNPSTSYICSTGYQGGYLHKSGTSMSAPMVAGAIAILNQFLNLTNQYKTPSQIETILYNTGKTIIEGSNNFSRVNIFDAIISLDTILPNVTLISPTNNTISINTTRTFTINISDLQLRNITFYLWNSSNLVNQTSLNITGSNTQYQINITNLTEETYYWTLQAYDLNNNTFTASNYTITIASTLTTINSPANNTFTNQNNTNFTCTSQAIPSQELSNITFYIYNSTTLLYNTTTNVTGTTNTTIFNYTLPSETNYSWNCETTNNLSGSSQTGNYTLTYETTTPNLTIITPLPAATTSASIERIFYFNVSDNYENTNCSLLFDNTIQESQTITNYTITNNFTITLTPDTYNWKINCTDQAGNSNTSSQLSFTITTPTVAPSSSSGSSSSSGGATPTAEKGTEINPVTSTELKEGYTEIFSISKKTYFTTSSKENHTIQLNSITNKTANITIQSTPINLIMQENTNKKLNLTTPEYLDLNIEVGNITLIDAQIRITEIHERNPDYTNPDLDDNRFHITDTQDPPEIKKTLLNLKTIILTPLTIIIIGTIIFFIFKKRKPKTIETPSIPKKPKKETNKKRKNIKIK
jgi:subtilisin family serine protease